MHNHSTPSAIATRLASLKDVLVVAHYSPDADAYGSSCGLALGLRQAGIKSTVFNESGILARYRFIPGVSGVQQPLPISLTSFDSVVACDCGDENRLGDHYKGVLLAHSPLVNIDHHKSNTFFGTDNLVHPDASSTSEMVFEVLEELGKIINKEVINADVATCLFAGISADTGSFRYSSTSAKTLGAAQQLMVRGANASEIAKALYSNESISAVRLQAEALTQLRLLHNNEIALVVVPHDMLERHQATSEDTEALVERARDIAGVQIAVLLRQEDGLWKGSLRAKNAQHDVGLIAAAFGGGGHRAAAGFRWRKDGKELESKLLPLLEEALTKGATP